MTKANSKHWKSRPCAAKLKALSNQWVTDQKTYEPPSSSQSGIPGRWFTLSKNPGKIRGSGNSQEGSKTRVRGLDHSFISAATDHWRQAFSLPHNYTPAWVGQFKMDIVGKKAPFLLFLKNSCRTHIPKAVTSMHLRPLWNPDLSFSFGFWDRISLCSPGSSGTQKNLPISASQVLRLKVWQPCRVLIVCVCVCVFLFLRVLAGRFFFFFLGRWHFQIGEDKGLWGGFLLQHSCQEELRGEER